MPLARQLARTVAALAFAAFTPVALYGQQRTSRDSATPAPRLPPAAARRPDAAVGAQATSLATTAITIAFGASMLSIGRNGGEVGAPFIIAGLVGGPAAGYLESGMYGRAALGIGIRTVGTSILVSGLLAGFCEGSCGPGPHHPEILGGLGLMLGSAAYDIVRVKRDVRRRDARRARGALRRVAPTYDPGSGAVGVQIAF